MDTMGDRILYLIRKRGRDDRQREYEQRELVAMLNGEMKAPNGKYYNLSSSATGISRLIGGNLTRPSLDVLKAICEMFDTDMEWLIRGNVLEAKGAVEVFVTDEAYQAGSLIDLMDDDMRVTTIEITKKLYGLSQERSELQADVYSLLQDVMPNLDGDGKIRAKSVLRKIRIDDFPIG